MSEQTVPLSVSQTMGSYLKALWALGNSRPASTGALARRLGVSPGSVSVMLGRMAELGLVDYQPYRGASLSESGRAAAVRLVQRHRLLETFLLERLGYDLHEVHEEASGLEHALSERLTRRLNDVLGNPSHDPHGDPIPTDDGMLPPTPDLPLAQAPQGARFRIWRLLTQDSRVLQRLADLGLFPGQGLFVTGGNEPEQGLDVEVQGRAINVPRRFTELIVGEVEHTQDRS